MEILCFQCQFTGSAVPLEKAHPHASKTAFLIIGLNILASHPSSCWSALEFFGLSYLQLCTYWANIVNILCKYCEQIGQILWKCCPILWTYCQSPPKTHSSWVFDAPAVCAKEVTATSEVFATRSSSRPTAPVWLNIYQLVEFLQTWNFQCLWGENDEWL